MNPENSLRQENINEARAEPRFGSHEKMLDFLENSGEILVVRDIDEVRPELKGKHTNLVDIVDIDPDDPDYTRHCSAVFIEFNQPSSDGQPVQAIFKPFSGENPIRKNEFGFEGVKLYLREKAGYLVDHFLEFDTVPATGIREINGEVGAITLYINPNVADISDLVQDQIETEQNFSKTEDAQKIALLSFVISDADANWSNILIRKDGQGGYSIDHGFAFSYQLKESDVQGVRKELKGKPIPQELLEKLEKFQTKKDSVYRELGLILDQSRIDQVFGNIQKLLAGKKFL